MLLPVLAAVTIAGCTENSAAEPTPAGASHGDKGPSRAPSATATGTPLMRLKAPPTVAGELSRRVLAHQDGRADNVATVRREARAGQEYWIHAACTSTTPGKALSVELTSGEPGASDDVLAATEVACDGTVTVNGLGHLPAEPIVVHLRGDESDVLSGYAIVAPTPSLPKDR